MSKNLADRPGLVIFIGGLVLFVAASALGAFLAKEARDDLRGDAIIYEVGNGGDGVQTFLANRTARWQLAGVNVLMWMVFSLGVVLTLLGLRLLTRPNLDFVPSKPLCSIRDIFEDPE